ncbi:MAG: hypothetical protein ABF381_11745 [Akkermansiaceae bacterium]
MPETPPDDPYQPPADWEESELKPHPGYQPILKRWHPLRLKYNLIMLGVGVLAALPALSSESIIDLVSGALFYWFLPIYFSPWASFRSSSSHGSQGKMIIQTSADSSFS